MEREDAIWLAGLLEGEGSFFVSHSNTRRAGGGSRPVLLVCLEMCDEDVVERAAGLIGSGVRYRPPRQEQNRATYASQAAGARAEATMRAVLPYMGQRRTAKIEECLATPNLSHTPKGSV